MKNKALFILIIIALLSFYACDKNNQDNSSDKKQTQSSSIITESDVVGFYTGRGLYNAGDATIELYYGGSFEMEDPYLPDGGTAFGKWVMRGNSIDFYIDGQKTFSANISKRILTVNDAIEGTSNMKVGGIILNGQFWKKVR
jgi:hypothetical protein